MAPEDNLDRRLEAALADYSRVEPAPGSVERWLRFASAPPPRRPFWRGWAVAMAALLVGAWGIAAVLAHRRTAPAATVAALHVRPLPHPLPRQASRLAHTRPRGEAAWSRHGRSGRPLPAVEAGPAAAPGVSRSAWTPFPLPRPMTPQEAYAWNLAQRAQASAAVPPGAPALDQDLTVPELEIAPLALAPLPGSTDISATKDGNR